MSESLALDDPSRIDEIRRCIRSKPSLERWYRECYASYAECVARCPAGGAVIELGAGASFAKEVLPQLKTTDLLPYEGVDDIVDARSLPFAPRSVSAILMTNVFHHIPDVGAFLREAERCLVPGGRVLMVEPHAGWLSTPLYRNLHHEPFDTRISEWAFESTGPLSSANGALAWMVFRRDRTIFESRFPGLIVDRYEPHTPLRYFLSGGLQSWSLLPGWAFGAATALDRALSSILPELGSFVTVELVAVEVGGASA